MRVLALVSVVLMLLGAANARPASAETTEIVLLGRSDLLPQNVPQRRITRIERFVPPVPASVANPALDALDDAQAPLLAAIPQPPTVWEPLVGPLRAHAARQEFVGGLAPPSDPVPGEVLSAAPFDSQPPLQHILYAWTPALVLGVLGWLCRRWIALGVNRVMLYLVVAMHRPGAGIHWNSRGRGGRRRSRHRATDVSWYFRTAGSRRRRRRSRWSSSYRPREYVVTDVVYATAPAPQYLLAHSGS